MQFIAIVKNKHYMTIGKWMTNNGREYIDQNYVKLLKHEGIDIQQSIPAQLQMNDRAQHFNHTINKKAESMHHQACLPDSWWEFCILHVNYLYNRTPMWCLDWKTPKGYLEKVDSDISHLHILGCRAYIFIHNDVQANKLSPKSELMTFLGFHDDHELNLMFM